MYSVAGLSASLIGVAPFGHSRIIGYCHLPGTFRRLSRPSSASSCQAIHRMPFRASAIRKLDPTRIKKPVTQLPMVATKRPQIKILHGKLHLYAHVIVTCAFIYALHIRHPIFRNCSKLNQLPYVQYLVCRSFVPLIPHVQIKSRRVGH